MKVEDFPKLGVGQVVVGAEGTAWQKQPDGTMRYADSEFDGDLRTYEPFTLLLPQETPWVLPPEVEEVLKALELGNISLGNIAQEIRTAYARARASGSYVPSRTDDYRVSSQALCDAADLLEEEGMDAATISRLRELCKEVITPHDE